MIQDWRWFPKSFCQRWKTLLDVQAKHTQTQLLQTGARVRLPPGRNRSTLYNEWMNPWGSKKSISTPPYSKSIAAHRCPTSSIWKFTDENQTLRKQRFFQNLSTYGKQCFLILSTNNCFASPTSNSPSVTDIFPEKISQWSSGVHWRLGIAMTIATKTKRIFRGDRRYLLKK